MTADRENSLRPSERDALRALREDAAPSPDLYRAIADGLRRRDLTRGGRSWAFRRAAVAAGILLAFVVGRLSTRETPTQPPTGASFALFMIASPDVQYPDSLAEPDRVTLYRNWAAPLAAQGRLALGEELAPRRFAVNRTGAREVSAEGAVDGMFIVSAPSTDSALALARSLPHVRYGGVVMVQPLMQRE